MPLLGGGSQPPCSPLQGGGLPRVVTGVLLAGRLALCARFIPGECLGEAPLWYFAVKIILTCCLLFALLHRYVRIHTNKEEAEKARL